MNKPKIKLINVNENAFNLLGLCSKEAKNNNWSQKEIDKFLEEATEKDYDHLLQTINKYFEVL